MVASPSDQPAIGPDLDLDLLGILGVAGRGRRAAPRASPLILGNSRSSSTTGKWL